MICIVIKGPSIEEAHRQIAEALPYADLVELRLDYFEMINIEALKQLRSAFSIPMIFTLRSELHGGNYAQSETNRLKDIRRLVQLKPDYLDLENHLSYNFISEILNQNPEIKLILSYHNFSETPENLEELSQQMRKVPAAFYKIAVTARSSLDALRLLCWAKNSDGKTIVISMGPDGQISRILGPVVGSPINYAYLEENQQTAPGQLSAATLIERYRYRSLNLLTEIYGLIGNPVDTSISDETHNHLFKTCNIDAVYVKIQVDASELSTFLQLSKQLPFKGLSVTMPLKELLVPLLDHIDPQALAIGAVNTLTFQEDKISGFNTDGLGALDAIENHVSVKGKQMLIIGAGGAAKAIAYEAIRRGGIATILNRNVQKAQQIAVNFQCTAKGLTDLAECAEEGYDMMLNCTPASIPVSSEYFLPYAIYMDIKIKPKESAFLKCAIEKGSPVIYGYQMFVEQATSQFSLWFKERIPIQDCRKILESKAIECLLDLGAGHKSPGIKSIGNGPIL